MGGLLGEEAGFLAAEGAALRRDVGAVDDPGVGVGHVPEGTNGGAGGISAAAAAAAGVVVLGGIVDFGVRDLLARQQVLELVPRRRRRRRRLLRWWQRRLLLLLALGRGGGGSLFGVVRGLSW